MNSLAALRNWTHLYRQLMWGTAQPFFVWQYALAALIASVGLSSIVYGSFNPPSTYTQLIVGNTTWTAANKLHDYVGLLFFVISTLVMYLSIHCIAANVHRADVRAEYELRDTMSIAGIPAVFWFACLFMTRNSQLDLLLFSAAAILYLFVLTVVMLWAGPQAIQVPWIHSIRAMMLLALFTSFSGLALGSALSRLPAAWSIDIFRMSANGSLVSALIGSGAGVAVVVLSGKEPAQLKRIVCKGLTWSQGLLPLLYFILIPMPWQETGKYYGYPVSFALGVLLTGIIVCSYRDLWKRAREPHTDFTAVISPWTILAILYFLRTPDVPASFIHPDDYHFGEFLLPWWLLKDFGYLPMWDYVPARGLMNYLPGVINDIFFAGTAATFPAANALLSLLYLLIGFLVFVRYTGILYAAIAFFLMPLANTISEIDVVSTLALCFLCGEYLKDNSIVWLWRYLFVTVALILFAPGQGGLFALALTPLVLLSAIRTIKLTPFLALRKHVLLLAGLVAVFALSPLYRVLLGAIRYGLEQSSVNSVANGSAWDSGFGFMAQYNPFLWELARASWIFVAIIAGIAVWSAAFRSDDQRDVKTMVFGTVIMLLAILYIPRAAARIDPNGISRLGVATAWFNSLLLLLLARHWIQPRVRVSVLVAITFWCGILWPYLNLTETTLKTGVFGPKFNQEITLHTLLAKPANVAKVDPQTRLDFADYGFGAMGVGENDPANTEKKDRLVRIGKVLTAVLQPGETYLDLTNRNAQYYYLGFPPPIEVGAVYNLVNQQQQIRAIERLERIRPPLVLASADNILHDGGPVPLRSHLLYRYVVERYVPIVVDDVIWLVLRDRLAKIESLSRPRLPFRAAPEGFKPELYLAANPDLAKSGVDPLGHFLQYGQYEGRKLSPDASPLPKTFNPETQGPLSLLNQAFHPVNLQRIPYSWGRSVESLQTELTEIAVLDMAMATVQGLSRSQQQGFQCESAGPSIGFNLEMLSLSGRQAGLLRIEFGSFSPAGMGKAEVIWRSVPEQKPGDSQGIYFTLDSGVLLIPLDAAPGWLLSRQVKSLTIRFPDMPVGAKFHIGDIRLLQRTAASKLGL